jgi:transcriptional regulator with XRE-family HTH domain
VNAKRVNPAAREASTHGEPSDVRRTFAHNLRQAREAAGLTQNALAKIASCSVRQLVKIETTAANVKLDTITQLARSLGLSEIDLLLPDIENILNKRHRRTPDETLSKIEPSEFRRQFARNLRARRAASRLIQKMLAKAAGMQTSSEVEIELHATNVTLDTVTRLAKALGVSEIDLLHPASQVC